MSRASQIRDRQAAPRPTPPAELLAPPADSALRDTAWLVCGGLALLVLLWTCRGYPRGIPVADDYSFLAWRAFHPLDLFDSMGATYYWRPLSRQLYFSVFGRTLLEAPWIAAFAHAGMLLLTYAALWRIARRGFSAPIATAIAVFPLLSEPARALLAWPSGAQHLLAGMFAALALHEAFAARAITALLFAGLGMLSHESGALALCAVPAIAGWQRYRAGNEASSDARRMTRHVAAAMIGALAIGALWVFGYRTAQVHGVALPPRAPEGLSLLRLADLGSRAIPAALDLEDLAPVARTTLSIGYVLIAALALMCVIALPARRRVRALTFGAAGLAWFVLGALPLSQLLPDWNAWRAWLPTLGLGLGLGAALASLHPGLAIGFAGLRLVALVFASPGPAMVAIAAPATPSHMSYRRLVRLQRTVESTRQAMLAMHPALPRDAAVRFWNLPRLAEVGFQEHAALRVWYRDSTLTWGRFGGVGGLDQKVDALVEYRDNTAAPAQALESPAFEAFLRGGNAMMAGRLEEAEAEFQRAEGATRTRGLLYASLAFNRSWLAVDRREPARAESLLRVSRESGQKADADYWALVARIAIERNNRPTATAALSRCLALEPNHVMGREIARVLAANGSPPGNAGEQTR